MNRRRFLTTCGVGGSLIVAGCSSNDGSTGNGGSDESGISDSDIPDFEVNEDAPAQIALLSRSISQEKLQYRDEFTVDVLVANIGGQAVEGRTINIQLEQKTGEFSAVDTQSQELFIEQLESGETTQLTTGSFTALNTGEWTFSGDRNVDQIHDEFRTGIEVFPIERSFGEAITTKDGVEFTLEKFNLQTSFFKDVLISDTVTVQSTPDSRAILIIYFTVRNSSNQSADLGEDDQFNLSNSQIPDDVDDALIEGVDLPQDQLDLISLEPNEETEGVMIRSIDLDNVSNLTFEYFDFEGFADSTPEFRVPIEIENPAVAEFELVELIVPDTWQDGAQEVGAVVKNTGEVSGTFRGIIGWYEDGSGGLATGESYEHPVPGYELEVELDAGEEGRVTADYDLEQGTKHRLEPFGEEFTL